MKGFILRLFKILFLIVLPFFILIRSATFLHEQYGAHAWVSLLGGIFASAVVILLYLIYLQERLTGYVGSLRSVRRRYWLAFSLVAVYCLPGLFYLSAGNAKHEEVRREFRTLHPVLRLGVSTLVILDRHLILTDANRYPDDYRKMGLKTNSRSLHYRQSTGYAHAVDIRTRGHSELRNRMMEAYFRIMGFNTLRHVGTADHLHVSISSRDKPGGI
jgi:hypothetical protein